VDVLRRNAQRKQQSGQKSAGVQRFHDVVFFDCEDKKMWFNGKLVFPTKLQYEWNAL
jgi:hypothetical protein